MLGAVILGLLVLTVILFMSCDREKEVQTISPFYIGGTEEKAVALMFNVDWGEEVIPGLLAVLEEKKVTGTFFVTGRFARKFSGIVKDIAAAGHEIGNHGFSHPHPDMISLEQNQKEIQDTEKVFQEVGITYSKLFAPPYGEHKSHVLQGADLLGYKTIMWTVDTIDWQEPPPDTIVKRVLDKADNGALILMHPKKCTLSALPAIIDGLKKQEFTMKTVSAILQ